MVGGVVTAGIAAADYRYLVLQQQTAGTWCCSSRYQMLLLLLLLLLLWASQQQKKVGPLIGTEAIGAGRWCGKIMRVVGTCGS